LAFALGLAPRSKPRVQFKVQDGRIFDVEFWYSIDSDSLMPGGSARVGISFFCDPNVAADAFELDTRFDVLEADKLIGTGRVVEVFGYEE
jgi:hypothetical protein